MVASSTGLEAVRSEEVKNGYNFLLKGVIVGPATVGKTALLQRFMNDVFSPAYVPTIGVDFDVKSFRSRDGDILKIQIWDIAGEDRFRTITNSYYRGSHGMMMVFDVGNVSTFTDMVQWLKEIDTYTLEGTPKILVGNKCDIEDERKVSKEVAEGFAKENGLQYVESSAKNNDKVVDAFQIFIEAMLQKQKERRTQSKEKPMAKGLASGNQGQAMSTMPGQLKMGSTGNNKSKSCTII